MDIRIRLALATSAMVRLYTIWNNKQLNFKLKHNLYRSLVLSILTYGCETWTINSAMQKKIQAFENKSYMKYQDRETNVFVCNRIIEIIGNVEPLLQTIKIRKLKWIEYISRHNNFCKTIMQGVVEGSRNQGRPKQKSIDNIVRKWMKKDVNCLIKDVHERDD